MTKRFSVMAALMLALASLVPCLATAQIANPQPAYEGKYVATDYNYGGPSALSIDSGGSGTGSQTYVMRINAAITLARGGRLFMPLATNAPILLDSEIVTPSSVSCPTPSQAGTCFITATVVNVHGAGSHVSSGTFGLQEAINDASQSGSGRVQVDPLWAKLGGTLALLQAANFTLNTAFEPNPVVVEVIGINGVGSLGYWYGAPGLSLITTPTALTTAATATLTTSTTGGSIATSTTPRFTITAVDQFGGETAAAADAASTATLVDGAGSTNSYTITAAGVPTGTGIVGYRVYVSASGGATQTETLEPAANLVCGSAPLSPLPGTCGAGSAILITALPATTAAGPPQGTSGAATALSSAHTTVVAKQAGIPPTMLPFNDTAAPGFFPVSVTSATTLAAGFDVMGELQYPANYFNTLGAKFQICGGGVTTPSAATVAGTWTLRLGPRQNSAGTSGAQVAVPWNFAASTLFTAALAHFDFCTDVTVTTTGTSGVVEGGGTVFCSAPATPTTATTCNTAFNAASTALDLTQQGVLQVTYVQSAASWTLPQLRYLTIRRL